MAAQGPGGGGIGRGGRGLAILEALKNDPQLNRGGLGQGSTLGRGAALGRAAALQQQIQPVLQNPAVHKENADVVSALFSGDRNMGSVEQKTGLQPMGRGNLAGMLALMKGADQPVGRGSMLAHMMASQLLAAPGATSPVTPAPVSVREPGDFQAGSQGSSVPVAAVDRMQIKDDQLARKPTVSRPGSGGKPMKLASNYIKLKVKNRFIYQYHVNFCPIVDSKAMRCGLLNEHKDFLNVRLFDGSILYMPTKLPNQETILFSTRKTDGAKIKVLIRFTKELPSEQCPHLYNILLRRVMHIMEMCQVGRYYYNPSTPSHVPAHKLEVWPGYISAIKEHEGGLFLMLDSSHRVLRTETVLDMMSKFAQEKPHSFQDDVLRNVVGCVVLTRYNNKTYRIDDIEWDKKPSDTFETSSGKSITFQEYYWTQYGKKVDGSQPLLIHRPKARKIGGATVQPKTEVICLIPELCYLTGLTDDMRKNYSVMKDLAVHTRVTPNQRLDTMKKFIDSINKNTEARKQLEDWGLQLDTSAIAVDGRQLNIETISMGNSAKFSAGPRADWSRELSSCQLISTVSLNHWLILYIQRNSSEVNNLLQEIGRACPNMGMAVQPPVRIVLSDDKTDTLIRSLRQNVNPKIQLVMVVFPTSRDDKYNAVKKYTVVDCPVPSQVILNNTLRKKDKLKSVVQKIMFQVNVKLGGVLWAVKIPLDRLMVIGIDTFHDVVHGRRSIGGFVSNIDPDCTRWFSRVCIQMKKEELLPGLTVCVSAAIKKYYEVNHFLPEKIVIYRDGVGDGQLSVVSDYEVKQIESCFSMFGLDYQPKTTVIVVQKRINTRIFLREGDRNLDNPPSGTVLDHTVTRREMYDFFLVSQHVRQGTVSPTHYIVLHDDIGLPPERNQVLAYKMTHLYYNWPGTVRVPAPCLYAHKLAYLVGQSIHKQPAEVLCDRLFFL